jgi:hypothetical protein
MANMGPDSIRLSTALPEFHNAAIQNDFHRLEDYTCCSPSTAAAR